MDEGSRSAVHLCSRRIGLYGTFASGRESPGTAIATFDEGGSYPRQQGVAKNSAIYLGKGMNGSIWVLDQWNPAHPPQPREVRSYGDPAYNVSNNANSYSVIRVPGQ